MTKQTHITIHKEGKIDIHNRERSYKSAIERLSLDQLIIADNKKLILAFIRDCSLGKTIKNKRKKKIGPARCLKYIFILKQLSKSFSIPFNDITQNDMEEYICNLENDLTQSLKGKPYSDATKLDIKNTIRKFWKWKDGENNIYPPIVEWIDTYIEQKDIPALRREEIEKLVENTGSARNRALLMILFDSGARIEELLNVRLKKEHLFWKENVGCYMIRLEFSKTKTRTVSIPLCTEFIRKWLEIHPAMGIDEAQLFPMTYGSIRMFISRHGRKALNKRVSPHILRHSSATFYANKLSRYQLCYRYGWAMSSNMPDRYIDREGIYEEETAKLIHNDAIFTANREKQVLKEELAILKESNSILEKGFEELKREQNSLEGENGILQKLMLMASKQEQMSEEFKQMKEKGFDIVLPKATNENV